jgi:hypothetical protein
MAIQKSVPQSFRQGDLLFVRVSADEARAATKEVPRQGGRLVLARGESTGHAHAIAEALVKLIEVDGTGERFLKVTRRAIVVHEEHASVTLTRGTFRVVRQVEYSPAEVRRMVD